MNCAAAANFSLAAMRGKNKTPLSNLLMVVEKRRELLDCRILT